MFKAKGLQSEINRVTPGSGAMSGKENTGCKVRTGQALAFILGNRDQLCR